MIYTFYCVCKSFPSIPHDFKCSFSFLTQTIIFPRWSLRRFYSRITQKFFSLESGEQGIQGAFNKEEIMLLERRNDIRRIDLSLCNDSENNILQYPLFHLCGNFIFHYITKKYIKNGTMYHIVVYKKNKQKQEIFYIKNQALKLLFLSEKKNNAIK